MLAMMPGSAKAMFLRGGSGVVNPITREILAAQRSMISNGVVTNTALTSRAMHYSHPAGAISNLQFIWAQWYYSTSSLVETAVGNSSTITASIEYPAGTFTQITFGGQASAVIADGGLLTSDNITISIPAGTQFWVRTCHKSNGSHNIPVTTLPAACNVLNTNEGNSTAGDLTMSGTISTTSTVNTVRPVAILGDVGANNARSYILTGDSICWAQGDVTNVDAHGGSGYLARALISQGSYTKLSCGGQGVHEALSATTKLSALLSNLSGNYSDMVCEYGVNDLRLRGDTAQLETDLASYWALYGGRISQCTLTPRTTSTDGWTTTGNQTVQTAPWTLAKLNTINDWVRTTPAGVANYVETADAAMSARDSGLWAAHNPGWVLDGTHPTSIAAAAIGAAVAANLV